MIHETSFLFKSSNKKYTLSAKKWYNSEKPVKGILQVVHGMIEHIECYKEFAEYMAGQGFLVVGHDQIAHGNSVAHHELLGIMEKRDWFAMVEDVHEFSINIKKQYPHIPYFLLGHSMGSFVVRTYLMMYETNHLQGVLLSGTARHSKVASLFGMELCSFLAFLCGKNYRSRFILWLTLGQFNKSFHPNMTPVDWLSRDVHYTENFMKDSKCRFIFSLGAYRELFRGLNYISSKKNLKKMNTSLPIYLFCGDKDPVGNFGQGVIRLVEDFKRIGMEYITLKIYSNGRHEMLHELNKKEVFEDVLQWIENYL